MYFCESSSQRMRVLANGRLLEVHLGACKLVVVDRKFAATPKICLPELLAPNQTLTPIARDQHCGFEFEDYCAQ
jgi:hypothetical protein